LRLQGFSYRMPNPLGHVIAPEGASPFSGSVLFFVGPSRCMKTDEDVPAAVLFSGGHQSPPLL
jgi:hypothetical protein